MKIINAWRRRAAHRNARRLITLKNTGGDCDQDDSAWVKGYFDAFDPDGTKNFLASELAATYTVEHDEWCDELARGDRPNDTGKRMIGWLT